MTDPLLNGSDAVFLLDDFDSLLTAEMQVIPPGHLEPIGTITFAGPGHDQTIAQADRINRRTLQMAAAREQALTSGQTPKATTETPEAIRQRNVEFVADRIVDMSLMVRGADGQPMKMAFSRDVAVALLADRNKGWLFKACLDFLERDTSFMRRSEPI